MAQSELEPLARTICKERGMQFVTSVGEGTFKQTFHVINSDGLPIALKLYKSTAANPREQREINAMLRCDHSHIARLLSVEEYKSGSTNVLTLTEEFLEGGSLAQKGRINTAECLAIGEQLISAISHIAQLGLVHRDIKPDNIMFRKDGLAVLTDFGVARDLLDSSLTPSWAPRGPGTPFFASPEQLNNEKHLTDWRSDQFGLGVSLSYVTIGSHPYLPEGEPEHKIIELVGGRRGPTSDFALKADKLGLPALLRMVAPWPVQRLRTPILLAAAWTRQGGRT